MEKTLGDIIVGSLQETLKQRSVRTENHCLFCGEVIPPGFDFCTDTEPGLDICPDYSIFKKTKEEK